VVGRENGVNLAAELKLKFYESSAKENSNVKEVFELLVDQIVEKMAASISSDASFFQLNKGNKIDGKNDKQKSNRCNC